MPATPELTKLDLRKALKQYYSPSTKAIEIVDVPAMQFLMIDGSGDPNGGMFPDTISAINTVAYTLKFAIKKSEGVDFKVMPTEGQWWVENLAELDFDQRDNWLWTLMIAQPEVVTHEAFDRAIDAIKRKKRVARIDDVRLENFTEGLCAQIMHLGSYDAELPTIDRLHTAIRAQGYALRDKHHEIYLNDPQRTAPERLKTILRQPVRTV